MRFEFGTPWEYVEIILWSKSMPCDSELPVTQVCMYEKIQQEYDSVLHIDTKRSYEFRPHSLDCVTEKLLQVRPKSINTDNNLKIQKQKSVSDKVFL